MPKPPKSVLAPADARPRFRILGRRVWTGPHTSEVNFFAAQGIAPYPPEENAFQTAGDAFSAIVEAAAGPAVIIFEGIRE